MGDRKRMLADRASATSQRRSTSLNMSRSVRGRVGNRTGAPDGALRFPGPLREGGARTLPGPASSAARRGLRSSSLSLHLVKFQRQGSTTSPSLVEIARVFCGCRTRFSISVQNLFNKSSASIEEEKSRNFTVSRRTRKKTVCPFAAINATPATCGARD